VPVETIQ